MKPDSPTTTPTPAPTPSDTARIFGSSQSCGTTAKMGGRPSNGTRTTEDTKAAKATGMKLRGFHSNSISSTASNTAAKGVAKMAAMPAAAPATSSVFLSEEVRWKSCANREPKAPPVTMIGPSAPNGPPVPIDRAEEIGLRIATLGCIRLRPNRIASNASGMPCPRIFSEPYRAINPIISAPAAGTSTTYHPK